MSIDQNKRRKNPQITQLTMEQVNEKFRDYEARISQLEGIGAGADMHGRRIANLGDAEQSRDAINRGVLITTIDETLNSAIQPIESALLSTFLVLSGTDDLTNERYWSDGHGIFSVDGGAGNAFTPSVKEEELDHNRLDNLAVGDVHTHYLLLAGRAGGQIGSGGIAAGETLALKGSAHASSGPITLNTNLSINSGGNVTLTRDAVSAQIAVITYGTVFSELVGRRALGTLALPTEVTAAATMLKITGEGWDGTAFIPGASISFLGDTTFSDTAGAEEAGSRIYLKTVLTGDTTRALNERLVIDGYGNILINATPANTPTSMYAGLVMKDSIAPTALVDADCVCLYTKDANAEAGKSWWHAMGEDDVEHQLAGIILKDTTGNPTAMHELSFAFNYPDDTLKVYANGAWRQIPFDVMSYEDETLYFDDAVLCS